MTTSSEALSGEIAPGERLLRASRLIPEDQNIETLPPNTPVGEALAKMDETDFSQMPVVIGVRVVGVFSHRSFGKRLVGVTRLDRLMESQVVDFLEPEEPVFVRSKAKYTDFVDGVYKNGYVLVGHEDDLYGILTFQDLLDAIDEFAKPYWHLRNIELTLRQLAKEVCSTEELASCVERAMHHNESLPNTDFDKLSLGQVQEVLFNGENWGRYFKSALGAHKEIERGSLERVVVIRNHVMHFTAECTVEEMQDLLDYGTHLNQRWKIVEDQGG